MGIPSPFPIKRTPMLVVIVSLSQPADLDMQFYLCVQAKSPYEHTTSILGRVKKPTEVEAKALAKCFPFAKSKQEGFDPNAECIVANAHAKKKAAFKGKQRSVSVNVVMLKHYQPLIPRGNARKELLSQERIKTIFVTRDMSNLEIQNVIIRAYRVSSFSFLDSDKKGHLTRLDSDCLDGEGAVKRRGSLYLCEIDVSICMRIECIHVSYVFMHVCLYVMYVYSG